MAGGAYLISKSVDTTRRRVGAAAVLVSIAVGLLLWFGAAMAQSATGDLVLLGQNDVVPDGFTLIETSSFDAAKSSIQSAPDKKFALRLPTATLTAPAISGVQVSLGSGVIGLRGSTSYKPASGNPISSTGVAILDWTSGFDVAAGVVANNLFLSAIQPSWKLGGVDVGLSSATVMVASDAIDIATLPPNIASLFSGLPTPNLFKGLTVGGTVDAKNIAPSLVTNSHTFSVVGGVYTANFKFLDDPSLAGPDINLVGAIDTGALKMPSGVTAKGSWTLGLSTKAAPDGKPGPLELTGSGSVRAGDDNVTVDATVSVKSVFPAGGGTPTVSFQGSTNVTLGTLGSFSVTATATYDPGPPVTRSFTLQADAVQLGGLNVNLLASIQNGDFVFDLGLRGTATVGQLAGLLKVPVPNEYARLASTKIGGDNATEATLRLEFSNRGPSIVTSLRVGDAVAQLGLASVNNKFVGGFKFSGGEQATTLGGLVGANLGPASGIPLPDLKVVVATGGLNGKPLPTRLTDLVGTDITKQIQTTGGVFGSMETANLTGLLPKEITPFFEAMGATDQTKISLTGALPLFGREDISLRLAVGDFTPPAGSDFGKILRKGNLALTIAGTKDSFSFGIGGSVTLRIPEIAQLNGGHSDRFDDVDFSVDAAVDLSTSGTSVSLSFTAGQWNTPLGISFIDFNVITLDLQAAVGKGASVSVGMRTKGDIHLPNGTDVDVDLAFAVGVGASGGVEAGVRVASESGLNIADIIELANMALDTDIDLGAVPELGLRRIEFSVSSIDNPRLCLTKGFILAADLYMGKVSGASPGEGFTSTDPAACHSLANPDQQADDMAPTCAADMVDGSKCIARVQLAITADRIFANIEVPDIDFGPATVGGQFLVDISSSGFKVNIVGRVKIDGVGSADGELRIDENGAFVRVNITSNTGGDNVALTLEGKVRFSPFGISFQAYMNLTAFQAVVDDTANPFVKAFNKTFDTDVRDVTLRCATFAFSANYPGQNDAIRLEVKFTRSNDNRTDFETASLGWDFGSDVSTNLANLTSLVASPDKTGCGTPPITSLTFQRNGTDLGSNLDTNSAQNLTIVAGLHFQDITPFRAQLLRNGAPVGNPISFGSVRQDVVRSVSFPANDVPVGTTGFQLRLLRADDTVAKELDATVHLNRQAAFSDAKLGMNGPQNYFTTGNAFDPLTDTIHVSEGGNGAQVLGLMRFETEVKDLSSSAVVRWEYNDGLGNSSVETAQVGAILQNSTYGTTNAGDFHFFRPFRVGGTGTEGDVGSVLHTKLTDLGADGLVGGGDDQVLFESSTPIQVESVAPHNLVPEVRRANANNQTVGTFPVTEGLAVQTVVGEQLFFKAAWSDAPHTTSSKVEFYVLPNRAGPIRPAEARQVLLEGETDNSGNVSVSAQDPIVFDRVGAWTLTVKQFDKNKVVRTFTVPISVGPTNDRFDTAQRVDVSHVDVQPVEVKGSTLFATYNDDRGSDPNDKAFFEGNKNAGHTGDGFEDYGMSAAQIACNTGSIWYEMRLNGVPSGQSGDWQIDFETFGAQDGVHGFWPQAGVFLPNGSPLLTSDSDVIGRTWNTLQFRNTQFDRSTPLSPPWELSTVKFTTPPGTTKVLVEVLPKVIENSVRYAKGGVPTGFTPTEAECDTFERRVGGSFVAKFSRMRPFNDDVRFSGVRLNGNENFWDNAVRQTPDGPILGSDITPIQDGNGVGSYVINADLRTASGEKGEFAGPEETQISQPRSIWRYWAPDIANINDFDNGQTISTNPKLTAAHVGTYDVTLALADGEPLTDVQLAVYNGNPIVSRATQGGVAGMELLDSLRIPEGERSVTRTMTFRGPIEPHDRKTFFTFINVLAGDDVRVEVTLREHLAPNRTQDTALFIGEDAPATDYQPTNHAVDSGLWYSWVAPFSGAFQVDNIGSVKHSLAESGTPLGARFQIGTAFNGLSCSANCVVPFLNQSVPRVFNAVAGTEYLILAQPDDQVGDTRVNITAQAPANDNIADATDISGQVPSSGDAASFASSTGAATREVGEPVHGDANGGSVWYRFTPTEAGQYFFSTASSERPTSLAVYRGDALGDLEPISSTLPQSEEDSLAVRLAPGETYLIALATQEDDPGATVLDINSVTDAPVAVTSMDPQSVLLDSTQPATISGAFFAPGVRVELEPAVGTFAVGSVAGDGLNVAGTLTIDPEAPLGPVTVSIVNLDGSRASCSCLTVFDVFPPPTTTTTTPPATPTTTPPATTTTAPPATTTTAKPATTTTAKPVTTTTAKPVTTTTAKPVTATTAKPATATTSTTTTAPPVARAAEITVGAGAGGGPHIRSFDAKGDALSTSFFAYDPSFLGGVPVARGDLDGDGVDEIVVGSGPGGGTFRVFSANGAIRNGVAPFGEFTGGVNVAIGDVVGDSAPEIIVAAGPGGGPHVRIYDGKGRALGIGFQVFEPHFTGGVNIAAGDVDGDGKDEIVVGAGTGGTPHVRAYNGDGTASSDFFAAYDGSFRGGVYVAAGDVNGDGIAEIVTGAGPGGGPHVRVFNGKGKPTGVSFFAYGPEFPGGVRVAVGTLAAGQNARIVTGAGPGGGPHVRAFSGNGTPSTLSFFAYKPSFDGGVFPSVAKAR